MAPKLFAPSSDLTLIGKGRLWFDRFDATDTASGKLMALGNCDKFSISVKDTVKKNYSSLDSSAAVYKTAVSQRDLMIKIQGFEFGPDQAALVSAADLPTLVAQSTATVSAEPLAAAGVSKHGQAFQTLNREISGVVVLNGVATLALGTDYTIPDAHLGLIYFPETSAVVDTTAVTINYTAAVINAASKQSQILGASVPKIRGKLIFSGDPMTGPSWDVIVPRVFMTPTAESDFISADFLKWTLEGTVESNLAFDPTIPYYKATRRV